jgi:transcriptional regulator with XRE-family HTH domain
MQQIRERLKSLMREADLTQAELERYSGVPYGTINRWLLLTQTRPTAQSLARVARTLGVTVESFYPEVSRLRPVCHKREEREGRSRSPTSRRLMAELRSRDLSVTDLHRMLGGDQCVPRSTLYKTTQGRTKKPPEKLLREIEIVLDLPAGELSKGGACANLE